MNQVLKNRSQNGRLTDKNDLKSKTNAGFVSMEGFSVKKADKYILNHGKMLYKYIYDKLI